MGQTLYRRYRSKNLAEIVGQEHITRTLDNTLQRGAIGHAYLLTGPHGVGKTSIARILAHEINKLPYEAEKTHLDIIEIDAASNRRIDEIRDLRDKVHIAPSSADYKVYIIDEVHMLTKEAFNALLKTLEEPPAHVIFILATTDVHKLPETIVSRTQHFTFKPIPAAKITAHLKHIASEERIQISDEAVRIIAEHGNGSFRDSIGLLEQASGVADKITADHVRQMLGVPPVGLIQELFEAFESGAAPKMITRLNQLSEQGFLAEEIAKQLSSIGRAKILDGATQASLPQLLKELIDIPSSRSPFVLLELTLLAHMKPQTHSAKPVQQQGEDDEPEQKHLSKQPLTTALPTKPATQQEKKKEVPDAKATSKTRKPVKPTPDSTELSEDQWQIALSSLKKSHSTLYSIARMASFATDGKDIILRFKFPFHKKRMETTKNKTLLDEIMAEVTSSKPVITFVVDEKTTPKTQPAQEQPKPTHDPLEAVSNIFGGGEVLES